MNYIYNELVKAEDILTELNDTLADEAQDSIICKELNKILYKIYDLKLKTREEF